MLAEDKWGHPYTPENTKYQNGAAICKHCTTMKCRAFRRAMKLKQYYERFPSELIYKPVPKKG